MKKIVLATGFALSLIVLSCNNANNNQQATTNSTQITKALSGIKEENITFTGDSATMNGYVAFDTGTTAKRGAILILPEWWGMTEYPKMRARELAKLGYIAMAMDIYGNGKIAETPDDAGKAAGPYYQNPQKAKIRIDAALATLKGYAQTDTGKIAIIGYCFGGGLALNVARMGENVKGVVSFHGSLTGVPVDKDLLKAKVLVCHGGADSFVPQAEVDKFKKQMDSIKADYTFKVYEGATHAFTNPNANEKAKKYNMPISYNPVADSTSWEDMKQFFSRIF